MQTKHLYYCYSFIYPFIQPIITKSLTCAKHSSRHWELKDEKINFWCDGNYILVEGYKEEEANKNNGMYYVIKVGWCDNA